jgi:hypothetical protein
MAGFFSRFGARSMWLALSHVRSLSGLRAYLLCMMAASCVTSATVAKRALSAKRQMVLCYEGTPRLPAPVVVSNASGAGTLGAGARVSEVAPIADGSQPVSGATFTDRTTAIITTQMP